MLTLLISLSTALATPPVAQAGAGLHAHFGGTFMSQPLEADVDGYLVPSQGWGGFGGGGGLALEGRFFGFAGVELDIIRRHDVARSTFTLGSADLPFQVSQNAWHIPLLVKFVMPTGAVRPNIFGGGQFVIPGDATTTQPSGLETELSATSAPYKAWAFGFGLEVVPKGLPIDLRFPISFRGAYNTGIGTGADDRADYTVASNGLLEAIDYRSVWQWHAGVTLGASVFFP